MLAMGRTQTFTLSEAGAVGAVSRGGETCVRCVKDRPWRVRTEGAVQV